MRQDDVANDRCDLDPNKVCDNCCKCIDSACGDDAGEYSVMLADFLADGYIIDDPRAASRYGENTDGFTSLRIPLDIDPELMEQWERKLREEGLEADAEAEEEEPRLFRGIRPRRVHRKRRL